MTKTNTILKLKEKTDIKFKNKTDSERYDYIKQFDTLFFEYRKTINETIILVNPVSIQNNKIVSSDKSNNLVSQKYWFTTTEETYNIPIIEPNSKEIIKKFNDIVREKYNSKSYIHKAFILTTDDYDNIKLAKEFTMSYNDTKIHQLVGQYKKLPSKSKKEGIVKIRFDFSDIKAHGYLDLKFNKSYVQENIIHIPIHKISNIYQNLPNKEMVIPNNVKKSSESKNKDWWFTICKVEMRDNNFNFIYESINRVQYIMKNKRINIKDTISRDCIKYLNNLDDNSVITIYCQNQKYCVVKPKNNKNTIYLEFEIIENYSPNLLSDTSETIKKRINTISKTIKSTKKKWKHNGIKVNYDINILWITFKNIDEIEQIRIDKILLLSKIALPEYVPYLKKINAKYKINITYNGILCLKLEFIKFINEFDISVRIIENNINELYNKLEIKTNVLKKENELQFTIKKNSHYSQNFISITNKYNIIKSIQLISSQHNHSTINHSVRDMRVTFAYYNSKIKSYNTFDITIHYCETCNRYFDIRKSFELQLQKIGLELKDVLSCFYDDYMNPIEFKSLGLNQQSLLAKYGYSVQKGGPSKQERQTILRYLIHNRIMSASEIKSFLSYLINFNGKKINMGEAIDKWENDIMYINKIV